MRAHRLLALLLAALIAGCAEDPEAAVPTGSGSVWLVSTEPVPESVATLSHWTVEIPGMVSAVDPGQGGLPAGFHPWFRADTALRVITIRSDAGADWKLGFRVDRASS